MPHGRGGGMGGVQVQRNTGAVGPQAARFGGYVDSDDEQPQAGDVAISWTSPVRAAVR